MAAKVITKDDFLSDSIRVTVEPYGVMEFSELLFKEVSWLDETQTRQLSAREFAVQLIHANLLTPMFDMQEIRGWSDSLLSFVAFQWLRPQLEESALSEGASFDDFKTAVYSVNKLLIGEVGSELKELFQSQQHFINGLTGFLPSKQIASSWANLDMGNILGLSQLVNNIVVPTNPIFDQINNQVSSTIHGYTQPLIGLGTLFQQVSSSAQYIGDALSSITASLPQWTITPAILQVEQFFASLPGLSELAKLAQEIKADNDAYEKAGYGFSSDFVSFRTIRRFASVNPRVRNAVITNHWAKETRSSSFEQQLQELFQQSSVLRRRWHIVHQVIKAHRRREYTLAIPTLLAQVEGVITDALIMNGLVGPKVPKDPKNPHKLYLKELNGTLKLGRDGKPIEATGLGKLIDHSKWQQDPALQGVAELITTRLSGDRNAILHGRSSNYGTAKLTNQGLLLLMVLSAEVAVFEAGEVQ
jgi:hypothetical protein